MKQTIIFFESLIRVDIYRVKKRNICQRKEAEPDIFVLVLTYETQVKVGINQIKNIKTTVIAYFAKRMLKTVKQYKNPNISLTYVI